MSTKAQAPDVGAAPFTVDRSPGEALTSQERQSDAPDLLPNGPGAAAILAAGIGSLALGIFAFAGDASPAILRAFNLWHPTGPLSGVTSAAVLVWLAAWFGLSRRWATQSVSLSRINMTAFAMLLGGLLLTFPPFMDLLQGK